MAVRTITYTVTADGVSPASIQSAGVQNDMNVTELIFDFKALKSGIMISGEELRYRFDCVDGAGGKFSTESNEVDYETSTASFLIGERLTRYGGNVSVCLVLTRIGKNKQGEDVTEAEMYCHPVNIRLKALPQGHHTDGGDRESITTLAENTKAAAEKASISAQDAEKSAQNAKIADAEINEDGMLVIHYYGGDVQVGPVIGPKGDKGDKGEKGDKGDKGDKGADAVTDQKYSPTSPNAQSGIAVAEAVSGKMDKFGTVDDYYGSVTLFGRTIYSNGKKASLTLDDVGVALKSNGVLVLNAGTQIEGNNKPLKKISTPDGTDPTQAANVEFVKKARDMQLLFDHTITESETSVWSYRVTLPFPIDKYYIYIAYPANLDTSRQFSINGTDANNTSTHVAYLATNTGTKVSVFRGEKLGTTITQWDAEFSYFKPFLYDCTWRPAYRALNLGNIVAFDVIDEQHFVEGTKIQIWGRDAI